MHNNATMLREVREPPRTLTLLTPPGFCPRHKTLPAMALRVPQIYNFKVSEPYTAKTQTLKPRTGFSKDWVHGLNGSSEIVFFFFLNAVCVVVPTPATNPSEKCIIESTSKSIMRRFGGQNHVESTSKSDRST